MEFRNTLYMSVLLVGGFICLHFYEASVADEFNAHNVILGKIIDEQETSFFNFSSLTKHNFTKSDEDALKFDLWNREVKDLKSLVAKPNLKNMSASKDLFAKYDVDKEYLTYKGEISYLTRFKILDGILNQSSLLLEELRIREKTKRQKDLHIIINQRQNNFSKNGNYELELGVVNLYNDVPHVDFFVEIDGQKSRVHSFPYLLPKNTNTGFIIGDFKNPVTGEKGTIKKKISP